MEKMESTCIVNLLKECLVKIEIIGEIGQPYLKEQRLSLQSMLELTMKEMQETGTFPTLKKIACDYKIENFAKKVKNRDDVPIESKKIKKTHLVDMLHKSVRKLITANKEKHDINIELATLMDDREDQLNLSEVEVNYYKKWYQAKIDQNSYLINKKQTEYQQNIINKTQQTEQEHRVANEIINFLRKSVQDLNNQLDAWKDKYENDLQHKEIQLKKVTVERNEQLTRLEELTKVYNERKAEIEQYNATKDEIKRKQEFEIHQNKMAIRIQSWWRGIMVRRHLGPFKDLARKPKAKVVKAKK